MSTEPAERQPTRPAPDLARPLTATARPRPRRPAPPAPGVDSLIHQLASEGPGASAIAPSPTSRIRPSGLPPEMLASARALGTADLDDVRVHYDSPRPAALDAQAYTAGREIHLAPGQERHLGHEAWHVVQQQTGRVRPTSRLADGRSVNEDPALEREADEMGARLRRAPANGGGPEDLGRISASTWQRSSPDRTVEGTLQLVRGELKGVGQQVSLANLEASAVAHLEQADDLDAETDDGFWEDTELQRLQQWRAQLDQRLIALRQTNPGNRVATAVDVKGQGDPVLVAMWQVVVTLANMRQVLNEKYDAYSAKDLKFVESDAHKQKNSEETKQAQAEAKWREQKAQGAKERKRGLGNRWGVYRVDYFAKCNCVTFHQHVPEGAASIQKCLKTGNILEAVYHTDKAFWIADPAKFQLGSANGKARMQYTFNATTAKSLVQDFLLCAGDFDEDNQERWKGETDHPYFTIWKTSEVGAFGVGAERLKELAGGITKIEAFDAKNKPIAAI